jgi:hypothetical protein
MEDDDCEINFNIIQAKLEIFLQTLNIFKKINIEDIKTYEESKKLEFNIDTIIKHINQKFKTMHICEMHSNYNINNSKPFFDRMLTMYEAKKKENENRFNYIHETIGFENVDRIEDNIAIQDQIIIYEYNDKLDLNEEYMSVKGKIAGMNKMIHDELVKGEQHIVEIDANLEETNKNLIKSNEELRQTALLRNKANTIKYPLVLGTIFGAVGTIVPIVGNAIGASLGAAVGYGVAKIERKAIKKIEPEKYK